MPFPASALSSQCMELVKQIECEDVVNSEDIFRVLEEMEELEERRNLILTNFDSQKAALRIVKKKLSKSWEDNSDPGEEGSENALDIDEEFRRAVKSVDEKKSAEASNAIKEVSPDESIDLVLTSSKSKSLETSLNISSFAIDTVESRMEKLFSNVDM